MISAASSSFKTMEKKSNEMAQGPSTRKTQKSTVFSSQLQSGDLSSSSSDSEELIDPLIHRSRSLVEKRKRSGSTTVKPETIVDSMKRPSSLSQLDVLLARGVDADQEEHETPASMVSPSSILGDYAASGTPITPVDPFDPSEETAKVMLGQIKPLALKREESTTSLRLFDTRQSATNESFTPIAATQLSNSPAADSMSTVEQLDSPAESLTVSTPPKESKSWPQALKTQPSLISIPEYASLSTNRQSTPRKSHVTRSESAQSLSETDMFSNPSSLQATPALTRDSSAGSSRPSSFFRKSSTSSVYTSYSVESLADAKSGKLSGFPSQATEGSDPANPSFSPQFLARPAHFDFATDSLTITHPHQPVSPVSPSKIGLGITTHDDEASPIPTLGRHKVIRSRSSSVAERIERARSTSVASPLSEPIMNRAIGLTANVTQETTHWSLKDSKNSQPILFALSSVAQFTRLTHLEILNCNLTVLPIHLAGLICLQELNISQNPLSSRTLPPFLASLVSLQALTADSCGLTGLQAPLSTLNRLQTLSIRHNRLRSLPSWLCHLEVSLCNLYVDGNPFQGQWTEVLRPILLKTGLLVQSPSPEHCGDPCPLDNTTFSLPNELRRRPSNSPVSQSVSNSNTNFPRNSQAHLNGWPGVSPPPVSARPSTIEIDVRPWTMSRPLTSQGWNRPMFGSEQAAKVKRMKSVSDLISSKAAVEQVPAERVRSASLTPEPLFAQAAQAVQEEAEEARTLSATSSSSKKKAASFFKKMSMVGSRLRCESEQALQLPSVIQRPGLLTEDHRSASTPAVPPKHTQADQGGDTLRPRIFSSASAVDVTAFGLSRASSGLLSSNRQFYGPPPLPDKSANLSLEGDESFDELESLQAADDPRAALRSVLAYLRDLDDLSSLDTSPSAVLAGLRDVRRGISNCDRPSRATSVHSSQTSPQYEGEGYLGDMDSGRLPHSSTNTASTRGDGDTLKLKVDLAKRERVINEILMTERSYVRGLEELFDIYISPAAQPVSKSISASGSAKESVIPLNERKLVFANAENIMQFHKTAFLPDLEAVVADLSRQRKSTASDSSALGQTLRDTAEEIARVFLRHGAFLKMYAVYVNNFESGMARLQSWAKGSGSPAVSPPLSSVTQPLPDPISGSNMPTQQQKKRMRSFLKQCREHPNHSQMNCESYLLMPVQRIPRYKMLLESLLCCTPVQEGTNLFPNPIIGAALELATNLARDLNEKKRESEGRQRLLYWQGRIGNKFRSPLVQPHRMLVKEARMIVERTVKRGSELVTIDDSTTTEPSVIQLHSLRVEAQSKPVIALLTSDILVLVNESADGTSPVDLFTVIRLGQGAKAQCASVFGNEATLRLVDSRCVVYLRLSSSLESHSWAAAINAQISMF